MTYSSYYQLPDKLVKDTSLNSSQIILFSILLRYSKSKGYCYASRAKLIEAFPQDVSTLKRNLRVLEEKGFIQRRWDKENNRKRIYPLKYKGGQECAQGGSKMRPQGGQFRAPKGVKNAPPIYNIYNYIYNNIYNNNNNNKILIEENIDFAKFNATMDSIVSEFKNVKLTPQERFKWEATVLTIRKYYAIHETKIWKNIRLFKENNFISKYFKSVPYLLELTKDGSTIWYEHYLQILKK